MTFVCVREGASRIIPSHVIMRINHRALLSSGSRRFCVWLSFRFIRWLKLVEDSLACGIYWRDQMTKRIRIKYSLFFLSLILLLSTFSDQLVCQRHPLWRPVRNEVYTIHSFLISQLMSQSTFYKFLVISLSNGNKP